jgi:hypothetical protein
MAVQSKTFDIPPLCGVKGCERFCQCKTFHPMGKNPYLKTCRKHNYKHLEKAK